MSSREQYKKYNTSLKKSIKTLEEKLANEEFESRAKDRTMRNLRYALAAAKEMVIAKKIAKGKLITFIWGMCFGIIIMGIMSKLIL